MSVLTPIATRPLSFPGYLQPLFALAFFRPVSPTPTSSALPILVVVGRTVYCHRHLLLRLRVLEHQEAATVLHHPQSSLRRVE